MLQPTGTPSVRKSGTTQNPHVLQQCIQIGSRGPLQSSNFITRIVLPLSWSCLFHLFYIVRDYNVRLAVCDQFNEYTVPPKRPTKDDPSGWIRESVLLSSYHRGIKCANVSSIQNGDDHQSLPRDDRRRHMIVVEQSRFVPATTDCRGRPRWMATLIAFYLAGMLSTTDAWYLHNWRRFRSPHSHVYGRWRSSSLVISVTRK